MIRHCCFPAALAGLAMLSLAASAPAQNLEFADALRAADAQAPRLAAQRAVVTSAGHQAARANELPDPKVRMGIENLPVTGPDAYRYDKDFMTMRTVGLMQEFPNSAKRAARGLAGERDKEVEIGCSHMAFGVSRRASRRVVREIALFLKEIEDAESQD